MAQELRPNTSPRRHGRARLNYFRVLLALIVVALGMAIYLGKQKAARVRSENADTQTPTTNSTVRIRKASTPREKLFGLDHDPPAPAGSSLTQLLTQLNNASLTTNERRAAARAIARRASADALHAVRVSLADSSLPSHVKAAMAEGLGGSTLPEARALLENLIAEKDEVVARGAIRGLATKGDAEAADALLKTLYDNQRAESVRTEAALALGDINQPNVTASLVKAMAEIQDEGIAEFILEGLGQRPLSETGDFFRNYLESPNVSSDLRIAAVEALANAQGDATPLLMKCATDADPEVRMAAGFALASTDEPGSAGGELLGLLAAEKDPQVRTKFYQALENQTGVDFGTALDVVKSESDASGRLAGLHLLAQAAANPDIMSYFNQSALAELKSAALTGKQLQDRLSATLTLRKLNTTESVAALQDIAQHSSDPKIVEAANSALRAMPR